MNALDYPCPVCRARKGYTVHRWVTEWQADDE